MITLNTITHYNILLTLKITIFETNDILILKIINLEITVETSNDKRR